jgi:cell division protein FtsQ
MPEQGTDILAHFGQDRFVERYQRYKAHIAEWRQQFPSLAAVDLRYDQQVVLKMASGKEASQPAPGAGVSQSAGGAQPAADGKPSAGTPAGDAKPQPEKKPAAKAAAKSHAEHDKKKHAEPRHTALNEIIKLMPALAGYLG